MATARLPSGTLRSALSRLAETPFVPAAASYLERRAGDINAELEQTVIDEIPAFSESGNPDILPELAAHASAHTDEIIRLLRGGIVGDFAFVDEHARRRADQRFPLEATLHAYRCGHKVYSCSMREAADATVPALASTQSIIAAVADFAIEYTDAVSTIAASSYVAQTRLLAEVEGGERAELLSILLDGYDESDGRVNGILRDAGYLDSRQSFCVALAQPVDPSEMRNPARARRLADAIDKAIEGSDARRLIDVRQDTVTIVFSSVRRTSGWTAPRTSLARRLLPDLAHVGPAALIGVSNDAPSTSHIPAARREARLALDLADVRDRVVQFSDIPARRLMLHLAGNKMQSTLPPWSEALFAEDDRSRGTLIATLRAYADADMNVLNAAKALDVHPNTIYARLKRIIDVTGLDARSYHSLTELLLVADCRR